MADDLTEEQAHQVQTALDGLQLKGELRALFYLSPGPRALQIDLQTEDILRPGKPMALALHLSYSRLGWPTADRMAARYQLPIAQVWQAWARAWLGALMLHEMDEQLQLDGRQLCDPHQGMPPQHLGAGFRDAVEFLFRSGLGRLSLLANTPDRIDRRRYLTPLPTLQQGQEVLMSSTDEQEQPQTPETKSLDEMTDEETRRYFHDRMGAPLEPNTNAVVASGARVWTFDGQRWHDTTDPSLFESWDAARNAEANHHDAAEHSFTLHLDTDPGRIEDAAFTSALFAAGCTDALLHASEGVLRLDFQRKAQTRSEAIASATRDVESTGAMVVRATDLL